MKLIHIVDKLTSLVHTASLILYFEVLNIEAMFAYEHLNIEEESAMFTDIHKT